MLTAEEAMKQATYTAEYYTNAAYEYYTKIFGSEKEVPPILIASYVNACVADYQSAVDSKVIQ